MFFQNGFFSFTVKQKVTGCLLIIDDIDLPETSHINLKKFGGSKMKNACKVYVLLFIVVFSFSASVYAEENKEGTLVYHVKYDYDAISKFLGMTMAEYDQEWAKGSSIAEMAKKRGIARRDVEGYFYQFHYEEMQKWRKKGVMTEKHYFHLVYRLADDIEEFIDRNPNLHND